LTDWQIFGALLLGLWLLQLPIRITHFQGTLGTLPDALIHTLGIVCGFLYWKIKRPFGLLPVLLGCLIVVFMYFQGYALWHNKRNFGTFTGRVEAYALPVKFEAFDEQKNVINGDDLNGRIVLLDFWFTRCGACFEAFPKVQAAYEKFKDDGSVKVFSVDKPIEEDKPGEAFNVIREEGYTFPVVVAADEDLPEKLGVKAYPTVLVIGREGKIVYRGDIEGAIAMADELRGSR
jgi:thiol-disulfide isomerase/thioredoxin